MNQSGCDKEKQTSFVIL